LFATSSIVSFQLKIYIVQILKIGFWQPFTDYRDPSKPLGLFTQGNSPFPLIGIDMSPSCKNRYPNQFHHNSYGKIETSICLPHLFLNFSPKNLHFIMNVFENSRNIKILFLWSALLNPALMKIQAHRLFRYSIP